MGILTFIFPAILFLSVVQSQTTPITDKPIWSATYTDLLKRDLFKGYDKFARPAEPNATTNCTLGFTIRHIEINEQRSIMTLFGWVRMRWTDHKLRWNVSDYGGQTVVHVAEHEIWQPDIVLYNNAGANLDHYGQTNLLLFNSGDVLWVPPAQFGVFCEMDLTHWPFDTQNCSFVFGSWTYHSLALNLDMETTAFHEMDLQIENSEWLILNISSTKHDKKYACCEELYPDVTLSIQIQRRSPTYKLVVITPATVVVLLLLAGFWLPATSGEKIILNGVVAVIITLLMLYFAQQLPVMAFATPLVVKFYATSLVLVAYSMIISTIVLACARPQHAFAVPWLLKKFTDGRLGKMLLLEHLRVPPSMMHRGEEMRENAAFEETHTAEDRQIIQGTPKSVHHQQDWIILATAIDRLSFLIYAFVFVIMAIVYSV